MQISFYEEENFGVWPYFENLFDLLFLGDIILNFVAAYYDEDYILVENLKIIAFNYFRTWLFIDTIAIFPFWAFQNDQENVNGVVRIARIGRMWKLVKLTRLIRILKIVKKKNLNLAHKATKALKMDSALERLFFFLFGAFFVIHILSCLWVFFCAFHDNKDEATFLDDSF